MAKRPTKAERAAKLAELEARADEICDQNRREREAELDALFGPRPVGPAPVYVFPPERHAGLVEAAAVRALNRCADTGCALSRGLEPEGQALRRELEGAGVEAGKILNAVDHFARAVSRRACELVGLA